MKKNRARFLIVLAGMLALCLSFRQPDFAQNQPEAPAAGLKLKLASEVLGEEREFFVALPAGYEQSQTRYPTLYLLDGGDRLAYASAITSFLAQANHIPPLIVVAVMTPSQRHHYRDFTPAVVDYLPASGGADRFLTFMRRELIPLIDGRYRTHPFRIISGQGLSGLFAAYALFATPETFAAAIATSPSLAFNDNFILKETEKWLAEKRPLKGFLFLAAGHELETSPAIQSFAAMLERFAPAGLAWKCHREEPEDQGSVSLIGFYRGLKELYVDWRFPAELAGQGLTAIQQHFQKLSEKFAYEIPLTEETFIGRCRQLFQEQRFQDALAVLRVGATAYPDSFQVEYWSGFVCEKIKDFTQAATHYQTAFQKAEAAQSPMADFYNAQAERLQAKPKK